MMRTRRTMVALSALQLAAGSAGHVVAVRDGRSFDIALVRWRGLRATWSSATSGR